MERTRERLGVILIWCVLLGIAASCAGAATYVARCYESYSGTTVDTCRARD